ncbi:MAG: class I SAM-dependent methyltransferase [Chitinispirillia bacterium]|jgi:ubiquinone/menaquinone biosynthesis C-methylase UbiE
MSERAHPDDIGFKEKWRFCRLKGIIPWLIKVENPYRKALFWRYNFINKYCAEKDVLDIPCGMGWGTSLLKKCRTLIGVDISEEAINDAKQRYGNKASFQVGSMNQLNFSENSFDLISCLEGIEHVPIDVGTSLIAECHRVLRSEGILIISSPYCTTGEHSGNPFHVKEYKIDELTELLKPYFNVINIDSRKVDNLLISLFVTQRKSKN